MRLSDLAPIVIDEAWERRVREGLPELPRARAQRLQQEQALSAYDAGVLTATRIMADYYEAVVAAGASPKPAANWLMGDLQALLTDAKIELDACRIAPERLAGLIALIETGTISGKIAKDVLVHMFASGKSAHEVVDEQGLVQISDAGELARIVREVMASNPGPVNDFRSGKKQAMGFLMGQVMKATQGKGNPKMANEILQEELSRH